MHRNLLVSILKNYKQLNYTIMNENLNLVEILKDCPRGTKLYSTVYGDVKFLFVNESYTNPIAIELLGEIIVFVASDGKLEAAFNGECTLFPSKDQRDWSKFKPKQSKFDPKTLQPFDKVLVRDRHGKNWRCSFFSHISDDALPSPYKYVTSDNAYKCCIPYNDDTKHLVGTREEAPEYYRYWED